MVSMYFVWLALIAMGTVWVYHLLAMPNWNRLPDEQVRQLGNIIIAVLTGVVLGHFKKRLG